MTKDLIPIWYIPSRDYILVHSSQKDRVKAWEAYTRVVYLDYLEQDKIVFMRGDMDDQYRDYSLHANWRGEN